MASEYRLITLTHEELAIALASFRRTHPEFLPPGAMTAFLVTAEGLEVTLAGAEGTTERRTVSFEALTEPLITFCLDSNIKLPRAAEKHAVLSEGAMALEMRLDAEAAALEEAAAWVPRPARAKTKAWKPSNYPPRI
jgi:hypothetical protein